MKLSDIDRNLLIIALPKSNSYRELTINNLPALPDVETHIFTLDVIRLIPKNKIKNYHKRLDFMHIPKRGHEFIADLGDTNSYNPLPLPYESEEEWKRRASKQSPLTELSMGAISGLFLEMTKDVDTYLVKGNFTPTNSKLIRNIEDEIVTAIKFLYRYNIIPAVTLSGEKVNILSNIITYDVMPISAI